MICTALRQTEAWGPAHVELPDSELEELSDESWSEALSWLRAHRLPFSFARRIALMSETIFQNAAASPNVQILLASQGAFELEQGAQVNQQA